MSFKKQVTVGIHTHDGGIRDAALELDQRPRRGTDWSQCQQCKKLYYITPWQLKRGSKYCSKACRHKGDQVGVRYCFVCGTHKTFLEKENIHLGSCHLIFGQWLFIFAEIAEIRICITIEEEKIILTEWWFVSYAECQRLLRWMRGRFRKISFCHILSTYQNFLLSFSYCYYRILTAFEPHLGHASSLCSQPQFIQ